MAYGTKYYFEAPGLREAIYRLDLEKEGFTGTPQQITRDLGSLTFTAGKSGLDFDASLQPSRAEITLREQSIIQEIYGSTDRLWRATAYKKPPSGSYSQYFRGFVLGDMGRFDPGSFKGAFTLEAVDGLELLKNVPRPRDSSTDRLSAFRLIQEALEEISIGLDWALQWPWFYRLDDTSDLELVDGDEKLKTLYTWEDAHKVERQKPEGEGELRSHYNILRRLLQTLNLRLVQSQGQWWVRQRHVGRYGAETTHHYTPGTDTVQSTTQEDLVWDLSTKSSRVEERPSRYRRNLGKYTIVHDFGPYAGRGLPEGGLETLNNWSLTTPDVGEYEPLHYDHKDLDVTQKETANNEKAVICFPHFSSYPSFSPYLESDRFSFPSSTRTDEVLRLSFKHACEVRQADMVQAIQLEHNGWWLDDKESVIDRKVIQGEGVTVPLANPLKAPIPKETTLRVFGVDRSLQYPLENTTKLTLTETARKDDQALVGNLEGTIKPNDYVNNKPGIRYYTWSSTQTRAWFNHMYEEDTYATREIVSFMQQPNGAVVQGNNMKLWFALLNTDTLADDFFGNYGMVVDDISLSLTVGDSVVSQAEHDTLTGTAQAEEKQQSTYIGDGPSSGSKARLFYYNPNTENKQLTLSEFGLDSWNSNTYQGLRLPHLRGREYIRELRTKHERYSLRVHLNEPGDVFGPHHILKWGGDLWSIESYSHTPDDGYIDVEVLPLQDDGIAGLSYTSRLTTGEEDEGGGSISSSQAGSGTGPSVVNQWTGIGGGVGDGLFVDSSGVLSVEVDSGSFLNFDPTGILQAEVKDEDDMASDSADHLATQQSIKAYVDNGSEAAKANARAIVQTRSEIDALDEVTVRGSREVLISGTTNQITVSGRDGALTSNIVLSLSAPQDLHAAADFEVNTLSVNSTTTPSAGQVALGAQADETYEAVRADRTITVVGTTNQVTVDSSLTTQGAMTQDISVKLEAPQDLHAAADFRVGTLRVGTGTTPNAGGGHYTGYVGHPGYVAETDRWRISAAGLGDFRTLIADELRVQTFIAEVAEAYAGEDFLTKSFAKLESPFTVPSGVGNANTLHVQDLAGVPGTKVFSPDDTVRLRYIDRSGSGLTVADVWVRVTNYTDQSDGTQKWDADLLKSTAASGSDIGTGAVALDYGDPTTGGYLIERSVLDKGGSIGPYDRILRWEDTTGNRVPDDYSVLNLRGELGSLSKAYGSGPGLYTEQGRFTEDVIVGNLDAATSSTSGTYLKFSQTNGLQIVTGGGDVESRISQNEGDIQLIAQRVTQAGQARAGLEVTVSENQAQLIADVQFNDAAGQDPNRAAIELTAFSDGSKVRLVGDSIELDGNTYVDGTFTVGETNIAPDYTSQGEETQTFRQVSEPTDADASGRNLQVGDLWIDTGDGDKPHTYDGSTWIAAYTIISGSNITTGSITGPNSEFTINLDNGTFLLAQGSIEDSVTIGGVSSEQIRRGGTQFQDGMENEGADWDDSGSDMGYVSTSATVYSGTYAAEMYSSVGTASEGSGGSPGLYTEIPEEIALEFAGRTVEITIWAKANGASEFAVSYSTADAGDSGWQRFAPTASWTAFRFTYEVPVPSSGGSDYLGILGNADGGQSSTYIDRVTVRPQTQRVSGFEIGSKRIERYDSNGNLKTAIGTGLDGKDAANRTLIGDFLGNPTVKVLGDTTGDYVVASGVSSGVMFEVASGGSTVIKVEDSGNSTPSVFIDNLSLRDLSIAGTLTMGASGKIVNNASPPDFRLDADGFDMLAATGLVSASEPRKIGWWETEIGGNGTEVAYITADNGSMWAGAYGDVSSNYAGISLEARRQSGDTDYAGLGIDIQPIAAAGESSVSIETPDGQNESLIEMTTSTGGAARAVDIMPKEQVMLIGARLYEPTATDVDNWLNAGEAILYLVHETEGDASSDVRLQYYEKKGDGTVAGPKTIKD